MGRRSLLVVLVGFLTLVAAGCGGSESTSSAAGAEIAPDSTPLFISVNTDFESEQIKTFTTLLDKFPGSAGLLRMALAELQQEDVDFERDIKPALGPELDIVVVGFADESGGGASSADAVALLQPNDPAKLDELLAKDTSGTPTVKEEVEGWTVLAESQASIDRFKKMRTGGTLAGSSAYRDAMEGLPEDALARAYVNADLILESYQASGAPLSAQTLDQLFPNGVPSVGGTVSAEEGGLRFQATGKTTQPTDTFEAALPDELPAGAIGYVGFNNLAKGVRESLKNAGEANSQFDQQLGQAELALGLSIERDLLPLLEHEGAIAVYPAAGGSGFPGVQLVLEVDDAEAATGTIDKLLARAAQFSSGIPAPQGIDIGGVEAKAVEYQGQTIIYAGFDGKLVVTNARETIEAMQGSGAKLAGDETFSNAKESADVPGETSGLLYVNLNSVFDLVESQEEQPPQVQENVEPLDSFLLYSTAEDGRVTVSGFLAIQ
ncbi:MAG TPA: DUF3352 domain-containing protein [Gaiellaceae bacterium]|nr:DUF3352 domain-containing protein [Gaiellaceae bacterium]